MRVTAIGWRAHEALTGSAGLASVVAPLSSSFYAAAAGHLIWVGGPGATMHPRAVLTSERAAPGEGATVRIAVEDVTPWRPASLPSPSPSARDAARRLRESIVRVGEPRGLARLLTADGAGDLVLDKARSHVTALARACAADDASAFADTAQPLLGLGPGLTPSGDDFVGGALFARRVLVGMTPAWEAVTTRLVADAATLTHPISARLLGDLAAGEAWAPLHDLATALTSENVGASVDAARRIAALGHTSGWDLLAGILAGLT
jgi:hypothetical protein